MVKNSIQISAIVAGCNLFLLFHLLFTLFLEFFYLYVAFLTNLMLFERNQLIFLYLDCTVWTETYLISRVFVHVIIHVMIPFLLKNRLHHVLLSSFLHHILTSFSPCFHRLKFFPLSCYFFFWIPCIFFSNTR